MNPIIQLLINPAIISLCAGFIIGVYRMFEIPSFISNTVALYLVFCIGFKGGLCLGVSNVCSGPMYSLVCAGILIGFIQPFIYYFLLNGITTLDRQTLITIASQYGSISIVTFLATLTFLQQQRIPYDTFMSAVAGIMEIPALISGLLILKGSHAMGRTMVHSITHTLYQIARSKKISFIFLGLFLGYALRSQQAHPIIMIFLWPFTAMLIAFMIDIGIKIAQQRAYIHEFSWSLIAFGIYTPIISGLMSLIVSYLLDLSVGTTTLFAALVGSASYIAVPAVMSSQAPEAREVIYLPLALGITLPFNLVYGIPLFYYAALYMSTLL